MDREITDEQAMVGIHRLLSSYEWDSDTLEDIAELVNMTGRTIQDVNEFEPDTVDVFVIDGHGQKHLI